MKIISYICCDSGIGDRVPRCALLAFFALSVGFSGICNAGQDTGQRTEPVYGAGPSTQIVSLFFKHFAERPEAEGVEFLVPERSTKHEVNVGLVVDRKHLHDPLVEAVERYASSEDWRQKIESEGYFAADNADRSTLSTNKYGFRASPGCIGKRVRIMANVNNARGKTFSAHFQSALAAKIVPFRSYPTN